MGGSESVHGARCGAVRRGAALHVCACVCACVRARMVFVHGVFGATGTSTRLGLRGKGGTRHSVGARREGRYQHSVGARREGR